MVEIKLYNKLLYGIIFILVFPAINAEEMSFSINPNQVEFYLGDEGILELIINNFDNITHSGNLNITTTLDPEKNRAGYMDISRFIPVNINQTNLNLSFTKYDLSVMFKPGVSFYNVSLGITDYFVFAYINVTIKFNNFPYLTQSIRIEFSDNQLQDTSDATTYGSNSILNQGFTENKNSGHVISSNFEETLSKINVGSIISSRKNLKLNAIGNQDESSNKGDSSIGSGQDLIKSSREQLVYQILYGYPKYKKINNTLSRLGYYLAKKEYSETTNFSFINLTYRNVFSEASLKSKINLTNVVFLKQKHYPSNFGYLLILVLGIVIFLLIKRKRKTKNEKINIRGIYYKKEAKRYVRMAEKLFNRSGHSKETYRLLDEGFKYFLSHGENKNRHMSKEEILNEMKEFKSDIKEIKEILDECEGVSYLEEKGTKQDFEDKLRQIKKFMNMK